MSQWRLTRTQLMVIVVVAGVAVLVVLHQTLHRDIIQWLQPPVLLITGILGLLVRFWGPESGGTGPTIEEASGRLATDIRDQWARERKARRLDDPYPLPVRWHLAPPNLTDHPVNVFGKQHGPPPDLSGDVDQIPALLDRVAGHRVVVLGDSGTGKSVLAIQLTLRLIEAGELAGARTSRVPVIVGVATWDPAKTELRDWLARQLAEDYPQLRARAADGKRLAEKLLAGGEILPVLDGFDELPPSRRAAALERLDEAGPLVLTSRTDEYVAAFDGRRPLHSAGAITLCPLAPSALDDYLPLTTNSDEWQPILQALATGDERLAEVFRLPLMVGLARSVYSDAPAHASELLDAARFPTAADVEDHLLDNLVPAAYAPDPPPGVPQWPRSMAAAWLGALAARMTRHGQQDLAWWRLRALCPRLIPTLAILAGALTGLGWGIANFFTALSSPVLNAVLVGVLLGVLYGLPVGLGVWLLARPRPVHRFVGRMTPRSAALGTSFGLLGTAIALIALRVDDTIVLNLTELLQVEEIGPSITIGLAVLVGVLLFTALAFDERVEDLTGVTPTGLLRADRSWAIVRGIVCAIALPILVFWFALAAENALWPLLDALAPAEPTLTPAQKAFTLCMPYVVFASALLGAVLSSEWGAFTVVRLYLWTRGEAPWCFIRFLDDAHRRGVLRRSGAHYQFRHAELQRRLSRPRPDNRKN